MRRFYDAMTDLLDIAFHAAVVVGVIGGAIWLWRMALDG